jgi:adenylate cyclase
MPDRATDVLTLDELADAIGSNELVISEWQQLGLLEGDGQRFPVLDLERCRLILYAERRGIAPADVAEACRNQGDLLGQFVELLTGGTARRPQGIEDAAESSGLTSETLQRVWVASGLGDQEEAYDDDLVALRTVGAVLAAGLPEDALLQLVRVFADALGRVAESESRLFHYYVHERLRAEGLEGDELNAATSAVSDSIVGLIEPTILYFHRKAFQRALRDDFVLHLTEATTPVGRTAGELTATILFVDLAGFSPLTQSMGDVVAAEVVERFSDLVRAAASRHNGNVVKQIGDEFMLAFTAPADAVRFGLAVDDSVSAEPRFPGLRIGAHHGTLLYREGDYIGTTVNIAARVTAVASRHEFLITDALRTEAQLSPEVELTSMGPHNLRGISGEVTLHRVHHVAKPGRDVDPVCHMLLDDGTAGASLQWRGREIQFCSPECADRFETDPEKYANELSTDRRT